MIYIFGAFLIFGLSSFVRYLVLYRLGTLAERKRQKMEAYDIGSLIKECRKQKPLSQSPEGLAQPPASQVKSKNSQHKLGLTPAVLDSALVGANVFRQYMCIDDYMYEGIARMSGEQIDNFSDLSAKIKSYSHDLDGLTEGALNKIKGHVAEEHVAEHFEKAGARVDWPESSNQEGWDLLVNGSKIQIKLVKDAGSLTEHFKEHSDIPVVIPSDAKNIPETAFHFDSSEGMKSLTDFLRETPEDAVIVNHSLSYMGLTENTEQATNFLDGDIDLSGLPFITMAFSGFREFRLLRKKDTDIVSSIKNSVLDVAGTGIGIKAGGHIGATIGTTIFPGIGTAIGAGVGILVGGFSGRSFTNKIKEGPLKKAIEDCQKSAKKLKRKIRREEKKYKTQFNWDKNEEQKKITDLANKIKYNIDRKTRFLRKWIADREKPSEALKANLMNKVLSTRGTEKPSWTEWFWPKRETINRQIKMKNIKKILREKFQKNSFIDRAWLFEKFAEQGLYREFITSEIQKTEKERLSRENDLTEEIKKGQKQILEERYQSLKKLAEKIKDYVQGIREELSPYIKEVQNHQKLIKKEAKKLGKDFKDED